MNGRKTAALDRFRLLAVVLVVANHTSPLASLTPVGDLWLTRILARVAVPFFLMVSGYFLERGGWRGWPRFVGKAAVLYGVCVLLYLPLNLYSGWPGLPVFLKRLVTDGTFYHLWYFPDVMLGGIVSAGLRRLGPRAALLAAGALYLLGLGGDSYYGLAGQVPALAVFYRGLFALFTYARNGLLFTPLFLLLGAAGRIWPARVSAAGLGLSLAAMSAEGLWLHGLQIPRHDSMYLFLPLCMVFLFSLLLGYNRGERRDLRGYASLIFILHPWCIVLVRGLAKLTGVQPLLVQNSPVHFCAVLALSALGAGVLQALRPLPLPPRSRAWREVDLSALGHNARALGGTLAPGGELMAVVKADAYGHGAVRVARQLQKDGVRAFAVACLQEGIALRRGGIRGVILVLGYTPPRQAPLLARYRLSQTVADGVHGCALSAQGRPLHVHLALDTGMHRLGVPAGDHQTIAQLYHLPNLIIDGVFSHLCVSDSLSPGDAAYTGAQLESFYGAVSWMRAMGYPPGKLHIQASHGFFNLPAQPCRYARAGIALYGVRSDGGPVRAPLDLHPALALRARVALVRTLAPGERAGYGLAFRSDGETRLAVLTIGYADGLPRDLPQRGGQVLLSGRRCPMVGRMCMDQTLVDVTGLAQAGPGDVATLIGRDGGEEIRAEELAQTCGTITNELLSRLGARLDTVYLPRPHPPAHPAPHSLFKHRGREI